MRFRALLLLLSALAFAPAPALAWSNHGLLTYWAFKDTPEVGQAPDVVVEPLDAFLRDQEQAVADLLAAQESWARANVPTYRGHARRSPGRRRSGARCGCAAEGVVGGVADRG